MKISPIIALAPTCTKACPINHGRIMPPAPAPTRNKPAMVPVICMRSSERVKKVGKIEACEIPNRIVPIQRATAES